LTSENKPNLNSLYDEIGCRDCKFGWYGLLLTGDTPYIVHCVGDHFSYTTYKSDRAAKKAWDHICIRHERWFIEQGGYCDKGIHGRKRPELGPL